MCVAFPRIAKASIGSYKANNSNNNQTCSNAQSVNTKTVAESQQTPSQNQMQNAVTEWAKYQTKLLNNSLGTESSGNGFNTATVAYDCRTGNYYYGMNQGMALSGEAINPTLQTWMPEQTLNKYPLGNCAEIDAINQALNAGACPQDIYMYTINTRTFAPKPMCENCMYTLLNRVWCVFSG